jgi:hypothetical protein
MAMQKIIFAHLISVLLDIGVNKSRPSVSYNEPHIQLDASSVLLFAAHCPRLRTLAYVMCPYWHLKTLSPDNDIANLFKAFGTLTTSCKALENLTIKFVEERRSLVFTKSLGVDKDGEEVVVWVKATLGKALEEYQLQD